MAAPPAVRRPGLGQAAARDPTRTRRAAAGSGGSGPRRWPLLSRSIGEPCLVHGHPHAAASAEGHAPAGPRERIRETPGVAAPQVSGSGRCGARRSPAGARAAGPAEAKRGLRLPRARSTPRTEETRRESRGLSSFPHLAGGRLRGGEREGAPGGGQQPRSLEFVFAFSRSAEDDGSCSLSNGRKSAAEGGDASACQPGGEAPQRLTDYKSRQRWRRRT